MSKQQFFGTSNRKPALRHIPSEEELVEKAEEERKNRRNIIIAGIIVTVIVVGYTYFMVNLK